MSVVLPARVHARIVAGHAWRAWGPCDTAFPDLSAPHACSRQPRSTCRADMGRRRSILCTCMHKIDRMQRSADPDPIRVADTNVSGAGSHLMRIARPWRELTDLRGRSAHARIQGLGSNYNAHVHMMWIHSVTVTVPAPHAQSHRPAAWSPVVDCAVCPCCVRVERLRSHQLGHVNTQLQQSYDVHLAQPRYHMK